MEVLYETQKDVNWERVQAEIALIDDCCKKSLEDFILGKFDEECLGDSPPKSYWNDWFPPQPRMTKEELDGLRSFLRAKPKVTRTGRYTFQVDDCMVDFTSAVELPKVPKGLTALWGRLLGWLGDRYLILRMYKILDLGKLRKRGSIL